MIQTDIKAETVFDRAGLTRALGLKVTTVGRAVRRGELRAYRRAGRDFFLGRDVIRWLKAAEVIGNGRHDND